VSASISFIIPTLRRLTLQRAIDSIEVWPRDEVVVVASDPPGIRVAWGNPERQEGTDRARCDYLAFLDDDNTYVQGHRALMDAAIREGEPHVPILFRIRYPGGRMLWERRWVKNGNVDSQMILVPNRPEMLHDWRSKQRFADFHFINQWRWPAKSIKWREEVIALMSHEDRGRLCVVA
jgi:glycosyltransferase involved in cell wall biosynthesis